MYYIKNRYIGITCSLFRHGGVSLRTGTSKTPLPEFLRTGTSETLFFGVSAHRVPQKTSFPIRRIAAHGKLKNSTTRVSVHRNLRNSVFGISAHGVRQKTSFPMRHGVFLR